MQTSRYFFALWPNPVVVRQLVLLQRGLPGGHCLHPDDFHLTLAFLGSLPVSLESRLVCVLQTMSACATGLVLDRLDSFKRIRLTWVGPGHVPDGLSAMQAFLADSLAKQAIWHDDRYGFRPHVTLARKVVVPGRHLGAPIVWHADRLILARSGSLQPQRRYTIVAERHLGGTAR